MPKRWCQCTGCGACGTAGGTHGVLYDADATKALKCPPCFAEYRKRRNTDPPGRPSPSQRGYGADWRRISQRLTATARACAICGREFTSDDPATVDHIVPKARGGTNDENNLRVTHRSCNSRRSAQARRTSRLTGFFCGCP